jgi:hypothetical protein
MAFTPSLYYHIGFAIGKARFEPGHSQRLKPECIPEIMRRLQSVTDVEFYIIRTVDGQEVGCDERGGGGG